jgi:hypothetical protein
MTGRAINYPDGSTLTSSAYTASPNGGTIGAFLHPILLGMIGQAIYDPNSPLVRFTWPTVGAPYQDIFDDILYVSCLIKDEPYDKIREQDDQSGGTVQLPPTLTPLFSDNFTPNRNPLDPSKWATGTDGWGALQALNAMAQSSPVGPGLSVFVGGALPGNQYMSFTVGIVPLDGSSMGGGILTDASGDPGYLLIIYNDSGQQLALYENYGNSGPALFTMPVTANVGDTFTVARLDGVLYVWQNGVLLWSGPQNRFTSGAPFLWVNNDLANDAAISSFVTGSVAAGTDPINELWNYTRCWTIRFVAYGPNSLDNLRAVRSAMSQPYFTGQLALGQLFPVPDSAAPTRNPELHNAQWWERADLSVDMYEWVSEAITRQTIASVEVIVEESIGGIVADITVPLVGLPSPPVPPIVIDGGGFDGTGGKGFSPDGGSF